VAIDQNYHSPSVELDPLLLPDPGSTAAWRCALSPMSWLRICHKAEQPGS
jgi:hypothetical protein